MSKNRCVACAGKTVWESDVGSDVCTECGTLADASQSILESHAEPQENTRRHTQLWDSTGTLKSVRTVSGWDLSGQGKAANDNRNNAAIKQTIDFLTRVMSQTGLADRAMVIFRQAMTAGSFRWGKKAQLIAGASVCYALRENGKADSLRDIAFALREPNPKQLRRVFTTILKLLKLRLPSADPAWYIPTIQKHLMDLLDPAQTPECPLPAALVLSLKSISFVNVAQTAESIAAMITRLDASHLLVTLPAPATSCAILVAALEAELRDCIPQLLKVTECLAARFGQGGDCVRKRYNLIQDVLQNAISEIPWLQQYSAKKSRAKVSRRTVVARGTKEAVTLADQSSTERLTLHSQPIVEIESEDSQDSGAETIHSIGSKRGADAPDNMRPRKRVKRLNAKDKACIFLLNPTLESMPASTPNFPSEIPLSLPSSAISSLPKPVLQSLLDGDHSISYSPPTRLQLLTMARGGSEQEHILDDELFTEGELDAFLRDPKEAEIVRASLGLEIDVDWEEKLIAQEQSKNKRQKIKKVDSAADPVRTSRINYAEWTGLFEDKDEEANPFDYMALQTMDEKFDDEEYKISYKDQSPSPSDPDEQISAWRPPSPGHTYDYEGYEEEY